LFLLVFALHVFVAPFTEDSSAEAGQANIL
jgi:hypothetical protein